MSSNSFREMVEKLNQMEATGAKKSVLTEKAKSAPLSMGMNNEIYDAPKSISGILNENDQKKTEAAAKKEEKKDKPFDFKFTKEHDAIIKQNKEIENAKPKAPEGVMTKESSEVHEEKADEVTVRRLAELVSEGDEEELNNNVFILNRLLTTGPRSLNLLQRNIALDMFLKLIPVLRSSNVFNAEEGEEEVLDQEVGHEEEKKHEGEHKHETNEEKLDMLEDTLDDVDDELDAMSGTDETEKKDEVKEGKTLKVKVYGESAAAGTEAEKKLLKKIADKEKDEKSKSEKPKKKVKSKK